MAPAVVARVRETLLDPGVRASGLYDVAAIEKDASTGSWRDVSALWRALNVELWRGLLTGSRPQARRESIVS